MFRRSRRDGGAESGHVKIFSEIPYFSLTLPILFPIYPPVKARSAPVAQRPSTPPHPHLASPSEEGEVKSKTRQRRTSIILPPLQRGKRSRVSGVDGVSVRSPAGCPPLGAGYKNISFQKRKKYKDRPVCLIRHKARNGGKLRKTAAAAGKILECPIKKCRPGRRATGRGRLEATAGSGRRPPPPTGALPARCRLSTGARRPASTAAGHGLVSAGLRRPKERP